MIIKISHAFSRLVFETHSLISMWLFKPLHLESTKVISKVVVFFPFKYKTGTGYNKL